MLSSLVSFLNRGSTQTQQVQMAPSAKSKNPFTAESNVFFGAGRNNSTSFGKNMPLKGGYFAGYYNNKPNIVGRRLFIEA